MIIDWFDEVFNGICNGLVTVAEHPVLAGALALTALVGWVGVSRWSHR